MKERPSRVVEIPARTDSVVQERPRGRRTQRPKMRRSHARIAVIVAVLIIAAVAGLGYYTVHGINAPQGASAARVVFTVRPGDTPSSVSRRLRTQGLLHNDFLFTLDARFRGLGTHLQAGSFLLRPNMSIDQMITALADANPVTRRIIVVPGMRVGEIADELRLAGMRARQFLRAVRHPAIHLGVRAGWPRRHTLEGFLYPDTYAFDPNSSGKTIVQAMVRNFMTHFTPRMRRVAHRRRRSIYRIVTLASIVEREDYLPAQKVLIASVYWNRMALPQGAGGGVGKLLQSDPTVSYALGHEGDWWPLVPADRSTIRSPYNTFTHHGLPPGPIANPDETSLWAALRPAKTHYYYFKSLDGSGRLYFARTYAQFLNLAK